MIDVLFFFVLFLLTISTYTIDQERLAGPNQGLLRPPSQLFSNDQSALIRPYCFYKCELIYIAAKHPQDIERERAIGTQSQLYMLVSGEMATQDTGSMGDIKGQRSNTFLLKS